jgi:hypothetical protein
VATIPRKGTKAHSRVHFGGTSFGIDPGAWPCSKAMVLLGGHGAGCLEAGPGEALLFGWATPADFPGGELRLLARTGALTTFDQGERSSRESPASHLRSAFDDLVRVWTEETLLSSSTIEICTHWAYQRIIGLGPDVVPLILEAVGQGQRHWTWALAALTGENPARETDSQAAAADAWLRWADERGLIQRSVERVD